eukprot:12421863-Karenia_brevis.AAC.1
MASAPAAATPCQGQLQARHPTERAQGQHSWATSARQTASPPRHRGAQVDLPRLQPPFCKLPR